jgi:hypothetical protein
MKWFMLMIPTLVLAEYPALADPIFFSCEGYFHIEAKGGQSRTSLATKKGANDRPG